MNATFTRQATQRSDAETPSNEEVERAIEYLLAHRMEAAQQLLVDAGLAKSGSKSQVRKRLLTGLADDVIQPNDLLKLLDAIEGWGNQYIQLFKSTDALATQWSDRRFVKKRLVEQKLDALLNTPRPIWLPQQPELRQILYDGKSLRLVWAQQRTWQLRRSDLDKPQDGSTPKDRIIYKAYEVQYRRSLCYFDWDLMTGDAVLLMQKLPSGESYDELQSTLLDDMSRFIDVAGLEVIPLKKAMRELEKSADVSRRRLSLATKRQSEIAITSHGKNEDAYADPAIEQARKSWGRNVVAKRGFFYWQSDGQLDREIGMRVYVKDSRFSIERECTEDEVRHVLQGMRAIS